MLPNLGASTKKGEEKDYPDRTDIQDNLIGPLAELGKKESTSEPYKDLEDMIISIILPA
jgi:hypothetical protein